MTVKYTYSHNLDPIWGGDSLPDMSFRITSIDDKPLIPVAVCAQILNRFGEQVFEWGVSIDPDGYVLLDQVLDSSMLSIGKHKYTITYILEDGRRKTYFDGVITILKRIPKCKMKY